MVRWLTAALPPTAVSPSGDDPSDQGRPNYPSGRWLARPVLTGRTSTGVAGISGVIHIRRRTADDMKGSIASLAQVHGSDGYPAKWPADPGRWLTPSGLLDAWVAVAVESEAGQAVERVVGHVVVQDGAAAGPPPIGPAGIPPERLAYVARLFVAPAARGRGVAIRLLDECGRYAAGHRRRLVLDVADDGRAAIRLYERAGWRRVASTRVEWLARTGERALVHHYVSPTDPTGAIR